MCSFQGVYIFGKEACSTQLNNPQKIQKGTEAGIRGFEENRGTGAIEPDERAEFLVFHRGWMNRLALRIFEDVQLCASYLFCDRINPLCR